VGADSASEKQQTTAATPELGGGFLALMVRMCKEKYVIAIKADKEAGAGGEQEVVTEYRFGPRYFAEFGRQQIVKSYFDTLEQPIDSSALEDAVAEEQEEYIVAENDGAGDGAGAGAGDGDGGEDVQAAPEAEVVAAGRKRARK
jgi:hypothetical protein